ncbi:TBC1 domain family member 23 [Hypsibius exemplaris]|uniref:TBC1 domain family member 23 n=1 Tax=Hypsibius exemplaris TaxID=2072580 RepID=A0A1W0X3R2_HYPEX|nr:TBC1 domain family member 23 [Hypsibius exemplaris]
MAEVKENLKAPPTERQTSKESSPEDLESTVNSAPGDESWTMVSESSMPDDMAADGEGENSKNPEWIPELRQALDEQCGLFEVCRIASGRVLPEDLRVRAWQACLDIPWNADEQSSNFSSWDGMFSLESQSVLREQCKKMIDKCDLETEVEKLSAQSDIESVITAFCSTRKVDYVPHSGWLEILEALVHFELPTSLLYEFFSVILKKYVPKDGPKNEVIHHLFRLIVLYHDPELCNFIDSKRVTFDKFSTTWFASLLAASCKVDTLNAVWDIYFQNDDPFLVMFLGLVLLESQRDQIMERKEDSKEELCTFLKEIPAGMAPEDVVDFYEIANSYLVTTPKSLREANWTTLFGSRPVSPTKRLHIPIPQALCLPVTTDEIVTAATRHSGCRFFVIDCRPPEQYNSGHLVTAFHLDAQLLIQDAPAFNAAVDRLLASQKQAIEANSVAGGEHLCFMGSGFEAEDQYVHMVVARMLQRHHKYVSVADGGYEALLFYIEANALEADRVLAGTDVKKAKGKQTEVVAKPTAVTASSSFFGKLTSAMKTQLPIVKDKIATYISNPQASTSSAPVRHVSADDRPRKAQYRPQNVFVFDEEDEDYEDKLDLSDGDLQNWKEFIRRPDVLAHFECREYVSNDQAVPALLVISETDIYNFRPSADQPEMATMISQHSLMDVLKIVCRRKIPELITIKYGTMEGRDVVVTDIERFYIAKSGDAIKAMKLQILKIISENEGRQFEME